jgi:hypothetical protein
MEQMGRRPVDSEDTAILDIDIALLVEGLVSARHVCDPSTHCVKTE